MEKLSVRFIAGLVAFTALVAVVLGYFVMHKPFSPDLALAVARAVLQVLVDLAILSVAGGLGRLLIPLPETNPLGRLSVQAALGLGVLSLGVLGIGTLGGFNLTIGVAVLLILAGLLLRPAVSWWRDWRGLSDLWSSGGRLGQVIACGASLILLFTLASALAPPLKFDSLVYHLALPYDYLSHGRMLYVPQNMFWGMPQIGEMLYTWAMLLGGVSAAAVLSWLFGVLALVGLAGLVSARLGATEAWVSVAALLSAYTLGSALSWAYVDWLVFLFGLAFFTAIDLWSPQGKRLYLILAGVFVGLAMGAKYTAGVLLLSGAAVIIWAGWKIIIGEAPLLPQDNRRFRGIFLNLLQFGAVAALVFLPWLVKNLLGAGNPLYPFLFPSGAMTALRLALYQGGKPWGGWQDVLLLPFRATFLGIEGGPGYSASIGALLLGLGLAAWLSWRVLIEGQRRVLLLAGLVAFPVILVWMVAGRLSDYLLQSRLYFAIFPALAVQAGVGFAGLNQINLPHVRLGRLVSVLVVLVLFLNVLELGTEALRRGAPQVVLGQKTAEAYLADNLGWYGPAMQALRDLPAGSKTLLLWEPRSLNCLPKCEPDEVLDRWLVARYPQGNVSPQTPAQILQAWRLAGYTHLLYYRLGADFVRKDNTHYQAADWQALDDLLGTLHEVKDFGRVYTLYTTTP